MDSRFGKPVFFDPFKRRWGRLLGVIISIAIPIFLLLTVLLISVLENPSLPIQSLRQLTTAELQVSSPLEAIPPQLPHPDDTIISPRLKLLEDRQRQQQALNNLRLLNQKNKKTIKTDQEPKRAAFLVTWDNNSFISLQQHINDIDVIFPEWFHLGGSQDTFIDEESQERSQQLAFIKSHAPRLINMPVVNNYVDGQWDGMGAMEILRSPLRRNQIIDKMVTAIKSVDGAGLCLDLENLSYPPETNNDKRKAIKKKLAPFELYLLFARDLAKALRRQNLKFAICAPLQNPAFPYRSLATIADYVVLMSFDEHRAGDKPGALASNEWIKNGLALRADDIPKNKAVIALGNYAYDWSANGSIHMLSNNDVMRLARENQAVWSWDATSNNPHLTYTDQKNETHRLWMLDATTTYNHIVLAQKLDFSHFALWRLGSEDDTVWPAFSKKEKITAALAQLLATVPGTNNVVHSGKGECMRITDTPQDGLREIALNPDTSLINNVAYQQFPSPYVIKHFGAKDNKITLTFDDGPDPDHTPAILDILKKEHVSATFFIIGAQAKQYPELIERMYKEGHIIANHTFSHPDVSQVAIRQLQIELSATQRLIESHTNRMSILFRPPFGVDGVIKVHEQLLALETISQLGYLSVGMNIDPKDWQQPGIDHIVEHTVEQANNGAGNIVLLHDGGGDRTETVEALPKLIQELRDNGHEIVPLNDLLGTTRDVLMPRSTTDWLQTRLIRFGFSFVAWCKIIIVWLFYIGVVLGITRLIFIALLALLENRRKKKLLYTAGFLPSVAVIVPAYNEEKVVVKTVNSILQSDYTGTYTIMVIDDGSKDNTYAIVLEAFASNPRVQVLKKKNGGKSAALNYCIQRSKADIAICLDADTVFKPDTISKLIRHFSDPKVAAVAGNAKVGNRLNIMTRWQALEYITSQNLDRRAFSLLNCITVVPGAIGAWRRIVLENNDGFAHHTLAEDAELTITLRRQGYKIVNEDEAIALTEAPDTVRDFVKQRFRWMFGTIQAAFHHRDALFRPRYGALGWVALPNILLFQVFFPLISPIMDIMVIASLGTYALDTWYHASQSSSDILQISVYYMLFVFVDYIAAFIAFRLEPGEDKRLLWYLFLQRFFYRQLMYYVAVQATIAAWQGRAVGWGKLQRKATVQA